MKKLSLVSVLIFFLAVALNAQTTVSHNLKVSIPSYAIVGLSSTEGIILSPAAPTVAGEGLSFSATSATDDTKYLQYSSLLATNSASNSISVSMTENGQSLPDGVTVEVEAAENSTSGKGNRGTGSTTPIVLTSGGTDIVTGIKNGYTGAGSTDGHKLTYRLKMNETSENYAALTSEDFDITITYTITEN